MSGHPQNFQSLAGRSAGFWVLLVTLGVIVAGGGLAALYMEHNGHWVTGMTNQVGWGLPHVFAVFLIVASTGALNVASLGSVFSKSDYLPVGRLSALTAMAVQAGGLAVLILDLGRSDRIIVVMTHYNFTSIFSLNIILYTGFFTLVLSYLWLMMDPRLSRFYTPVAMSAFVWRLLVTTGTGSIFGLLIARSAYHSAIMAPMFIAFSLSFGLGIFNLVLLALEAGAGSPKPSPELLRRLRVLLAVFTAVSLYMVVMHHITNIYSAERRDLEQFMLLEGGLYAQLLWIGFVGLGSIVPLALLLYRPFRDSKAALAIASALVVVGGLSIMYVIIIGSQAFPLEMFPGKKVSSTFFDGIVNTYSPSWPEIILAIGGFGVTGLIILIGVWVLDLLPHAHPATSEAQQPATSEARQPATADIA